MTSGFRNSAGVDFDDVFDPYAQGTKPSATGFRTTDGEDLNQRFAPLSFGSAAPAQGFRLSNGADVNTLWAKKGTASYGLPINGQSFTAQFSHGGSSSAAGLQFTTNNGVFSVVDPERFALASGPITTGATKCQVVLTRLSGVVASNISNPLAAVTNLTAAVQTVQVSNFVAGSGHPALHSTYGVRVQYFNSAGTVISTTSFSFVIDTNAT